MSSSYTLKRHLPTIIERFIFLSSIGSKQSNLNYMLVCSRDQDEFVASKRMDQTSFLYTGFGEMPWT